MAHLSFEGKVALVTGADGDRGRRVAVLLAERGARLVLAGGTLAGTPAGDRTVDRLAAAADAAERAGSQAVSLAGEAGTPETADLMAARALEAFGRLDVLVHSPPPPGECRDEVDELLSTFRVVGPVWQRLRRQGHGRVVLASDVRRGPAEVEGVTLAMGLIGLTNVLAIEGRGRHLSANVVVDLCDRSTLLAEPPTGRPSPPEPERSPRLGGRGPDGPGLAAAAAYLAHDGCPLDGAVVGVRGHRLLRLAMGVNLGVFDPELSIEAVRRCAEEIVADDHLITPEDAGGEMPLLTAQLRTAQLRTARDGRP